MDSYCTEAENFGTDVVLMPKSCVTDPMDLMAKALLPEVCMPHVQVNGYIRRMSGDLEFIRAINYNDFIWMEFDYHSFWVRGHD